MTTELLLGSNTLDRVNAALIKSGYLPEGIISAQFKGMSKSGSEMHRITFTNDDTGESDEGTVYIDAEGNGDF